MVRQVAVGDFTDHGLSDLADDGRLFDSGPRSVLAPRWGSHRYICARSLMVTYVRVRSGHVRSKPLSARSVSVRRSSGTSGRCMWGRPFAGEARDRGADGERR